MIDERYEYYLTVTSDPGAAATLVLAEVIESRRSEPLPEWLTVKQAAKRLGVHAGKVYELCDKGQLRHTKVGRLIKIAPGDLGEITPVKTKKDNSGLARHFG